MNNNIPTARGSREGKGNAGLIGAHHKMSSRSPVVTLEHLPGVQCRLSEYKCKCYLQPGSSCFGCLLDDCELGDAEVYGVKRD